MSLLGGSYTTFVRGSDATLGEGVVMPLLRLYFMSKQEAAGAGNVPVWVQKCTLPDTAK